MDKRNRKLDIIKGICILVIILIHVLQRSTPKFTQFWPSSFLLVMSVPMFFFVSGISVSYRKPLSPIGFLYDIVKRALMYMWPFTLFLILRNAFYHQFESFSKGWSTLMDYPSYGLWVLWLLAWINLFIDLGLLISYFFKKYHRLIASITLVIAFIIFIILREKNVIPNYHFLGYEYFVIYTPIFIVGYLFGDKLFSLFNKNVSIILLVAGFIGTLILTIFVTPFLSSGYHIENNLYIYYLAASLSLAFYYGLSSLIENTKVGRIIALNGTITLEAYFLHLVLLKYWSSFYLGNVPLTILVSFALFLLCVANNIAVTGALYFIPFGHFLMFGRHKSFYKFENRIFDQIKAFCLK